MLDAMVTVILPVVIVAAVGALLARRFRLDQDTVGKISLYGFTPALAYTSLVKTTVSLGDGLALAGAYLAATALTGALAAAAATGLDRPSRRGVIAATVLGNNGNFGLPIALLALGAAGLDQAVILFVVSLVVMFTVGPALLGSHRGPVGALVSVLRLPVTWAMVAAVVVRITGTQLPSGLSTGIDLLAAAAIPLVLVSLGIQLGSAGRIHWTRAVLTATVARVAVLPVLSLGVGAAMGLRGLPLQSLLLAQSMPTAVNAFMLAREYGTDTDNVAGVVALSTVISLGTIAFVVSILPRLA
ncbi:MAG TPA: AEC family transporter [Dermatophilaceae bacterium]|nr:AEC family transporter [Dermatophilaceae bacterium]